MPDPDDPPAIVILEGYLGESQRDGHVRFYVDLDFRAYFEIEEADIVDHVPSESSDPASPRKLLIKATAKLDLVRVVTVEASYLKGAITAAHLSAAKKPAGTSTGLPFCVPAPPNTRWPCNLIIAILTQFNLCTYYECP